MSDKLSNCKADHGHHHHHGGDEDQGHQGHGHHHHHGQGGLSFLHQVIVDNELPLFESGISWADGGRWLDYGCGNGGMAKQVMLPHAISHHAQIVGIDKNQQAIEDAQKLGLPTDLITFVKGNIFDDWPFDAETSFDKILSIHVLQYFERYEPFLEKLFQILKSGGELGMTLPVGKLRKLFVEVEALPKWKAFLKEGDRSFASECSGIWAHTMEFVPNLKIFLEKLGFEVKTYEFLPYSYKFQDLDNFAELAADQWLEWKNLDATFKHELKEDVKQCIETIWPEVPSNSVPWPMEFSSLVTIVRKP